MTLGMPTNGESVVLDRLRKRRLIFACLLIFGILQSGASLIDAAPREKKPHGPLTLKITLADSKVCRGASTVEVVAELKNVSHSRVVIAPARLWYQYSLTHFHDSPEVIERNSKGEEIWTSELILIDRGATNCYVWMGRPHAPDNSVILKPGEVYRELMKFDPGEPPTFLDLSKYNLSVTYGQFDRVAFRGLKLYHGYVRSNEIRITVEECK
jgi:hypothetical protein